MEFVKSILYFILDGIFEIGGGYLMWLGLREGKSMTYGIFRALILIIYGVVPALQPPNSNFGIVYAA